MGIVYRARDERLQRTVAIKFLTDSAPDILALREARALARISHPNVVPIYDIIEHERGVALVMAYFDARPLSAIRHSANGSVEARVDILSQIAAGIDAIHAAGLVHADIKPANVLVADDGQVKVIDLGIACKHSVGEADGVQQPVYATEAYCAPEKRRSGEDSVATDIYAFGLLGIELLTGTLPSSSTASLNWQRQTAQSLPSSLVALLSQCIATKARLRPDSMAGVADVLAAVKSELVSARIGEQPTRPLTPADASLSATLWRRGNLVLGMVAALLLTSSMGDPEAGEIRRVVIVSPTMADGGAVGEQHAMVLASIDHTLRYWVEQQPEMQLVAAAQTRALPLRGDVIAAATQASDIVLPFVSCGAGQCEVIVERLTGPDWTVTSSQRWTLPFGSAAMMTSVVRSHIADVMGIRARAQAAIDVNEDSYGAFLALYYRIQLQGEQTPEVLQALLQLLDKQRHLYPAYGLLRQTVINVYQDSGESHYLDLAESTLRDAPYEYRQGSAFFVDMFWLALNRGDMTRAGKAIGQAQTRGLDNVEAHDLQAALYLEQGQYPRALEHYQLAQSLRFSARRLYSMALCHWYLGNVNKGQLALEQLRTFMPQDHAANQLLGALYLYSGQVEQAVEMLSLVVAQHPQSLDYNNLALAYMLQGDFEQARSQAQLAVEQSPQNPTWWLNLADTHRTLGAWESAFVGYRRVLALIGEAHSADDWLLVAQARLHLNQTGGALHALRQAFKRAPDNGEVAYIAALIYTALGEYQSAMLHVDLALQADIGPVWFRLPWFAPLCTTAQFREALSISLSECQRLDIASAR